MKVFLGQESRIVGNILRRALQSARCSVAAITDVHSGVELLRALEQEIDSDTVLVLDWNLPAFDLPTFLASPKGIALLDRVVLLLCVNPSEVPRAEKHVRKGRLEFIVRPFSDEDLCARIEGLVQGRPAAASEFLRQIIANVRAQENLPSLLGLPSALIARLFEGSSRTLHPPGTVLLEPGEQVEALRFVTSGEVEIEGPDGQSSRGVGECFGERAFICGGPAGLRVRTPAGAEIVAVAKETMVALARRHPAVQKFLKLLLMRAPARVLDEAGSELAGTLSSLGFPDLVQCLHSARKTGILSLEDGARHGWIRFEDGEVLDARAGGETGEAAFLQLAGRKEARFLFKAGAGSASRTIHRATLKLLLESCGPLPTPETSGAVPDPAYCTIAG